MFIWGISSKLTRRKGGGGGGHAGGDSGGGGDFGGGESGDGESSGYGSGKGGNNGNAQASNAGKGGKGSLKTSKVKGLPSNHNKATTYGPGGGDSFTVTSGRFKGLLFGGGSRDHVYGSRYVFTTSCNSEPPLNPARSYRPTGPVISNVVPFGFFDVNGYLEPLNTSQGYAYLVSVATLILTAHDTDPSSLAEFLWLAAEQHPTGRGSGRAEDIAESERHLPVLLCVRQLQCGRSQADHPAKLQRCDN